jgi:hypothetical protein
MGVYVMSEKASFFIDNLGEHKHDHNFTTSSWTKVVEILKAKGFTFGKSITKLIIWSDGALKTKENLFYFRNLAMTYKIDVFVNFFGPYHGHSEV